jgi:hypothetical protein
MTTFRVWVENNFEVEAEDEDQAKHQAMHDMAFGNASLSEALVVRVEPLQSTGGQG